MPRRVSLLSTSSGPGFAYQASRHRRSSITLIRRRTISLSPTSICVSRDVKLRTIRHPAFTVFDSRKPFPTIGKRRAVTEHEQTSNTADRTSGNGSAEFWEANKTSSGPGSACSTWLTLGLGARLAELPPTIYMQLRNHLNESTTPAKLGAVAGAGVNHAWYTNHPRAGGLFITSTWYKICITRPNAEPPLIANRAYSRSWTYDLDCR
jgi:hypothetical protein